MPVPRAGQTLGPMTSRLVAFVAALLLGGAGSWPASGLLSPAPPPPVPAIAVDAQAPVAPGSAADLPQGPPQETSP